MANKKFVPVEKRQKKEQREIAKKKRGTWFGVKPTTRVIQSGKREKLDAVRRKEAAEEY